VTPLFSLTLLRCIYSWPRLSYTFMRSHCDSCISWYRIYFRNKMLWDPVEMQPKTTTRLCKTTPILFFDRISLIVRLAEYKKCVHVILYHILVFTISEMNSSYMKKQYVSFLVTATGLRSISTNDNAQSISHCKGKDSVFCN